MSFKAITQACSTQLRALVWLCVVSAEECKPVWEVKMSVTFVCITYRVCARARVCVCVCVCVCVLKGGEGTQGPRACRAFAQGRQDCALTWPRGGGLGT
jgi:hypothetical protein